ncbi:hypothetical protein JTE90_014352 [Oedothorax gibbosus]|uniref:Uncharacterized protein n=1 Tax=Oedothorax gibbosus TaxID=931172 RepID=A0AAV6TGK1_9ARAC|nr:hypothetical protein JTE90_014352 [Oedothorax gibbosus]
MTCLDLTCCCKGLSPIARDTTHGVSHYPLHNLFRFQMIWIFGITQMPCLSRTITLVLVTLGVLQFQILLHFLRKNQVT